MNKLGYLYVILAAILWAVSGTASQFLFNRIRSTHASITATLEPITAGVISALFLGEMMRPLQILGAILVIVSIILLQWKPNLENGLTKISSG